MKYCVIKNTTKVIDGSENPVETMLQNAINAGLAENEVEILTEEEYQQRLENEPKLQQSPSLEERLQSAEDTILFLLMGGM